MGSGNQPRKFAVVTGASSGIGLELAKLFAADGYDLLIAAEDDAIHDAVPLIGEGDRIIVAGQTRRAERFALLR